METRTWRLANNTLLTRAEMIANRAANPKKKQHEDPKNVVPTNGVGSQGKGGDDNLGAGETYQNSEYLYLKFEAGEMTQDEHAAARLQ